MKQYYNLPRTISLHDKEYVLKATESDESTGAEYYRYKYFHDLGVVNVAEGPNQKDVQQKMHEWLISVKAIQ